jgi:tetratricopeptide (TPR) repeat protein
MSAETSAVERYETYTQADPSNPALWMKFGDVLHEAGLFDRAEQAFRRSLDLEPASVTAWGRIAAVQMSRGNPAEAEEILRRLLSQGERDTAVVFNLGLALYFQRRFEPAREIFEGLTRAPRHAEDASYYLISCLHHLNRADEAIERGAAFLGQFPSPRIRGYLSLVYLDASRMPEACEYARQTLREQPDNVDAAAVLGTQAIEAQQMDEAERLLHIVTAREPKNVRGWQGLALTALYRGQHDEAISLLQRAMASDPANIGNFITLGWVHIVRRDFRAAEKVYRDGIEVDRNDAELHGGLATALTFQNRPDEARREIALALGLEKQCFGALYARSILLRLDGKEDKATQIVANLLTTRIRPDGANLMEGLIGYWKHQRGPEK